MSSKTIKALNSKKVDQPCPRCSSNKFSVMGKSELVVDRGPVKILGLLEMKTTIPTIVVICDNCGYVAQHAQASLGLLPDVDTPRSLFGDE